YLNSLLFGLSHSLLPSKHFFSDSRCPSPPEKLRYNRNGSPIFLLRHDPSLRRRLRRLVDVFRPRSVPFLLAFLCSSSHQRRNVDRSRNCIRADADGSGANLSHPPARCFLLWLLLIPPISSSIFFVSLLSSVFF
ncbi:hypothetical protein LINGRAPRIM_LOCUS1917, partial [Linum grandiflorum]